MKALWKEDAGPDDYSSAARYLMLVVPPRQAEATVEGLRSVGLTHQKAKDLLRASGLALLPGDNSEVRERLEKFIAGEQFSPVLLVRTPIQSGKPLVVADGYHRICVSFMLDEDADIPCRIGDFAQGS